MRQVRCSKSNRRACKYGRAVSGGTVELACGRRTSSWLLELLHERDRLCVGSHRSSRIDGSGSVRCGIDRHGCPWIHPCSGSGRSPRGLRRVNIPRICHCWNFGARAEHGARQQVLLFAPGFRKPTKFSLVRREASTIAPVPRCTAGRAGARHATVTRHLRPNDDT
eukprot:SAG31_NODE_20854_length_564_cov_0.797849_1_plen_165_part_10